MQYCFPIKECSVHEKEDIKWDICSVKITTKELSEHFQFVQEGKKEFECEICNGKFKSKKVLKYHNDSG